MAAAAKKTPTKSSAPAKPGRKTATAAKRRTAAPKAGAPPAQDAIDLLIADHRDVERLYKEYEALKEKDDDAGKQHVAEEICLALRVHTQIEEEIFYPAVKNHPVEEDEIDEAIVEHAGAKSLIEQIEAMEPDEDLYDAKVKVLWEQVQHHVEEEETEMFPEVKKDKSIDLQALGAELAKRKEALTAELAKD